MDTTKKTQRFTEHFAEAAIVLERFSTIETFQKMDRAGQLMVDALRANKKIISCGNGGSMCDAMHFAEELTGRFRNNRKPIAALSISEPGHISCIANDFGYEYIFSRYVEAIGQPGDVLLAFSTSGNSQNVIKAIAAAREKDMKIVGLTGKDGGKMATLCDVEIRVPHHGYADRIQEIHIKCVHTFIDYIERELL